MKMKWKCSFLKIFIMIMIFINLVGCSDIRFDTNEIIKAPGLSNEYNQLKLLVEKSEGREISLVLPQTLTDPENSAIKIKDDLAIVVFNCADEIDYCVSICKKENGQWKLLNTLKKTLHQIDSVRFADFNGNGNISIVVSWMNNSARKYAISAYNERGMLIDEINNDANNSIKNLTLCDINSDGKLEVIAFFSRHAARTDFARVYSLDEKFSVLSECDVQAHIKYFSITAGRIDANHMAIFLDGDYYDAKEYFCTDAIFWNNGKLERVNKDFFDMSFRFKNEKSKDVDGDGIIEVPFIGEMYDFEKYGNISLGISVIWKKWSVQGNQSAETVKNKSYIYNDYARYAVMIPDRWFDSIGNNSIISLIDKSEKSMVFQTRQNDEQLFEIKIFTKDTWKDANSSSYAEITTKDNLVYAVKYFSDNDLNIPLDELKNRFLFL